MNIWHVYCIITTGIILCWNLYVVTTNMNDKCALKLIIFTYKFSNKSTNIRHTTIKFGEFFERVREFIKKIISFICLSGGAGDRHSLRAAADRRGWTMLDRLEWRAPLLVALFIRRFFSQCFQLANIDHSSFEAFCNVGSQLLFGLLALQAWHYWGEGWSGQAIHV